jgi:hypothetical protein
MLLPLAKAVPELRILHTAIEAENLLCRNNEYEPFASVPLDNGRIIAFGTPVTSFGIQTMM